MKRILKLSFLLLAFLLPATANAYDFEVDGIYYNINGNNATVTCYNSNTYSGDVVIPETVSYNGTTYLVTEIGQNAFYLSSGLTSVTIPNSVTNISYGAFEGCNNMTSVSFGNSLKYIGGCAFSQCRSLKSVEIPNSVTTIGWSAFQRCSGLTKVTIGNSVTSIGTRVFQLCASLDTLNFNAVSCDDFGSSVEDYDPPFYGLSLSVINIGEGVQRIPAYFAYQTKVVEISIPNSVKEIGDKAFYNCHTMTCVTVGNSIESIGDYAFYYCINLTRINITDLASWSSITFSDSFSNPCYYTHKLFLNGEEVKDLLIPNSVTSIGNYAFCSCTGITSVTFPNSVTSIGQSAFSGCSGLTSINIPNSVNSIGKCVFSGCSGLTSITVENNNMFYDSRDNCNCLIETATNNLINGCQNSFIPNSIISIGQSAFYGCIGLTSIEIPNSVISIGQHAFQGCYGLSNVTIGNSVTAIEDYTFNYCKNLSSLIIGNSVASIGERAFSDCYNLSSIKIPSSVTSISNHAFDYCHKVATLTIPNTITSIGDNAFFNCRPSVLFISGDGEWQGVSLYNHFSNSPKLYIDKSINGLCGAIAPHSDVYCFNTTPPICDDNSFYDYSGTLHVPAASLASYFTAEYWSNFTSIVGDAIAPEGINLSEDSVEVDLGTQFNLTASINPTNATPNTVVWISTNTNIASVTDGVVETKHVGECDIIAQCLNKSAICHVVVNDVTVTITLDHQEAKLLPNHMLLLTPGATPVSPEGYTVSSSDPTIASARLVNGNIQVVGIKEGVTTITVGSTDGTAIPATCSVTVYTELGDVNCDGFVNISDVTDLIDHLLNGNGGNFSFTNADCDKDGKVNITDVTMLIDYLLGGIDLNPLENETFMVGNVSFTMVYVKGGTFKMGVDSSTYDIAHQVTLSNYFIGQTEVTQELWKAVMGSNPSYFVNDQHPVDRVSWNDCQTFITKLNQMTGKNFRLPTEAEWEYAARGGYKSKGFEYAGSDSIDYVAWYIGNAGGYTRPVGIKAPNELELYDMSGNVQEWCQDRYGPYSSEAQTNPTGPNSGNGRVCRGGSISFASSTCRVSDRYMSCSPSGVARDRGFRIALSCSN